MVEELRLAEINPAPFSPDLFVNHIDAFRADLQAQRRMHAFEPGPAEHTVSPSGRFWLVAMPFSSAETRQELARIEVYQTGAADSLVELWVNDSHAFFGWVNAHGSEYLLCAEALLGGQTVVDLTSRQVASYAPPDQDGFIWTEFHLSPDGRTLAACGCYWACPYVIKLFDFTAPLALPLPEIQEIELLDNDEALLGWLDNDTLKARGVQRVREWQLAAGGRYQLVVVSETPMAREIRIGRGQ